MSKPVYILQRLMNVKVIRARMEPTVPMVWTSFTVTVHQDGLGRSVLSVSNKQHIVMVVDINRCVNDYLNYSICSVAITEYESDYRNLLFVYIIECVNDYHNFFLLF